MSLTIAGTACETLKDFYVGLTHLFSHFKFRADVVCIFNRCALVTPEFL